MYVCVSRYHRFHPSILSLSLVPIPYTGNNESCGAIKCRLGWAYCVYNRRQHEQPNPSTHLLNATCFSWFHSFILSLSPAHGNTFTVFELVFFSRLNINSICPFHSCCVHLLYCWCCCCVRVQQQQSICHYSIYKSASSHRNAYIKLLLNIHFFSVHFIVLSHFHLSIF